LVLTPWLHCVINEILLQHALLFVWAQVNCACMVCV
jgi:hypothetical protein